MKISMHLRKSAHGSVDQFRGTKRLHIIRTTHSVVTDLVCLFVLPGFHFYNVLVVIREDGNLHLGMRNLCDNSHFECKNNDTSKYDGEMNINSCWYFTFAAMLVRDLPIYKHHQVSSLAWAIASAPLMANRTGNLHLLEEDWCDDQFSKHAQWLMRLDLDPSPLISWLEQDNQKLLGKRFESMLAFWFENSPFFECLIRNHTFVKNKNTTGEIDFIIRDKFSDEIFHLEVACKYYIGVNHSKQWKNWIGPNGHDSLLLKMEKLKQQVAILLGDAGKDLLRELHLKSIPSRVLLKGFFFHPFHEVHNAVSPHNAHAHYNPGWYVRLSELENFADSTSQWLILPKTYWTCLYHFPLEENQVLSGTEMFAKANELIQLKRKSLMLLQVHTEENMVHEISRGFVVADKNF